MGNVITCSNAYCGTLVRDRQEGTIRTHTTATWRISQGLHCSQEHYLQWPRHGATQAPFLTGWEDVVYTQWSVTQPWERVKDCHLQQCGWTPESSAGKESTCKVGDLGLIPGMGRFPGEEKGYPLQYSGLENFMDCIAHGVAKVGHDWPIFTFQTLLVGTSKSFVPMHWYVSYKYLFLSEWVKVSQWCPTLCPFIPLSLDSESESEVARSPPSSSMNLQARILGWAAISFSIIFIFI